MTSFRIQSFFGLMNRLPYLLLGSLGSRIRLKPVVASLALQLQVTHPPARRNPAFFESLSNRALRLLLMPGNRQNGIRSVERFQGILNRGMSRWPTIQPPVSPVCRSAMPHRAAPSIYALSQGAVKPGCARRSTAFNGSTECEELIATYCSTIASRAVARVQMRSLLTRGRTGLERLEVRGLRPGRGNG